MAIGLAIAGATRAGIAIEPHLHIRDEWLSVTRAVAGPAVLAAAAVHVAAWRAGAVRWAVAAWMAAAALSPVLFGVVFLHGNAFWWDVLTDHYQRYPLPWWPIFSQLRAELSAMVAMAGAIVGGVLASRAPRTLARVTEGMALPAMAGAAVLLAAAILRAAGAPTPERYKDALPVVAALQDVTAGSPVDVCSADAPREDVLQLGAGPARLQVYRRCLRFSRAPTGVWNVMVEGPSGDFAPEQCFFGGECRPPALIGQGGAPLTVRHDAKHGLLVVQIGQDTVGTLLDTATGQRDEAMRDMMNALAPPRAWLVAGAVGLALALGALRARRRTRRDAGAALAALAFASVALTFGPLAVAAGLGWLGG